ncbi:MAG TPA: hypothetical protein VJ600_03440 [Holophagaceae bacterium]|nr:hypothetical protein [Holophagaceae bacterium]
MIARHLWAAWMSIALGMGTGAFQGLFFHREDWMEGYDSWPRRLMRLGHVSFFGLAFLNLAFAETLRLLGPQAHVAPLSWALLAGAVGMPAVCYLAAWRKPLRLLFYPLVTAMVGSAVLFLLGGLHP